MQQPKQQTTNPQKKLPSYTSNQEAIKNEEALDVSALTAIYFVSPPHFTLFRRIQKGHFCLLRKASCNIILHQYAH